MPEFRFVATGKDVTVSVADGGYSFANQHDDIIREICGIYIPAMRNGIAKNGNCVVEIADNGDNSHSLEDIQGLVSGTGAGKYTVYMDGVPCSYHALVDVSIEGETAQLATISWKGSI